MRAPLLVLILVCVWAGAAAGRTAAQTFPNDPLLGAQYHLGMVRAPAAWQVERGHPEVVLAVVSPGVDGGHRDLGANLWRNPAPGESGCGRDETGCNFAEPPLGGAAVGPDCTPLSRGPAPNPDVRDDVGLGTLLAGIAGAVTNNGYGIAGVAWNARVMGVKVSGCGPSSAQAAGITYAARQGVDVILLGPQPDVAAGPCLVFAPDVAQAVRAAADRGAVVVTGTGDGGDTCPAMPADLGNVIMVAAAAPTPNGVSRAAFSQLRPDVTLAAPGVDILGPVPGGPCRLCDRAGFRPLSGTAPAAALTAGAAMLVLSRNPLLGPAEVRDVLALGATRLGPNEEWAGAGLLNVGRSLELVPSTFTGRLVRDGADVQAEVTVLAFVANRRCAETVSQVRDGWSTYVIHVPPAGIRAGCGAPGAPVTVQAGDAPAAVLSWQPGAQTVDLPAPATAIARRPAETPPRPSAWQALRGARSDTGAELLDVVVTDWLSEDFAQPGPPVEVFRGAEQQVAVWTNWGGPTASRTLAFRWARPDGTIYREVELSDQCPCIALSRWQLGWSGPSGGDRMLDSPGVWQVDIYVDRQFIGAVQFRVEP